MKKTPKIPRLFYVAILLSACADSPAPTVRDMGMDVQIDTPVAEDMSLLGAVGEPCAGPRDCVAGALCVGTQLDAFQCMAVCETNYAICDEGVCLALTPRPESICYIGGSVAVGESCSTNLDCTPGNLCIGSGDDFLCTTACDDAHECRPDQYCRVLETGAAICSKNVGAVCVSGEVCADSTLVCTADVSTEYGEALGVDICTTTGCIECPAGSVCLALPSVPDTVCLGTCESNADCLFAEGWTCAGSEVCDSFDDPTTCRQALATQRACVPQPN